MSQRSLPELYEELKERRRHGELPDISRESLSPLIGEIASIAKREGLDMLSHILDMARFEAEHPGEFRHRQTSLTREQLARLLEIHALAQQVFGDARKAEEWLSRPNASLDGQAPAQLLKDDLGTAVVRDTLQQIDHGIFS
jgi:putative toxin-antitoxin system antitoxin component (TIGR02293 family)